MPARMLALTSFAAASLWAAAALAQAPGTSGPVEGFAMHGDVKYGPGFAHFDYVNPNAPKGGDVKMAAIGTFDSFNPFILRGVPAAAIGVTFDTLMVASRDEPFTEYCLVCKTIDVPADRSWAEFTLRPEARFHDGSPITPEDVIWTFDTLKTKGHPMYQSYYRDVVKAEQTGPEKVKFIFKPGITNRELPLILGQLPVLSKKYWASRDFTATTLTPPLGSGPYKVDSFEAGRFVTLRRVPDYWAANLPEMKGQDNFDTIRYDYYRDQNVALEAFLAGKYDIRFERSSKDWATAYGTPAVTEGLIRRETIPDTTGRVMQGYFMNTRHPVFQDRRVRQAMIDAFDFEWMNKHLFYGYYSRIDSYFGKDDQLSAHGVPTGQELAILDKFRKDLPPELFTQPYRLPTTDGSGEWRANERDAFRLLSAAGYKVENGKLVGPDGKPLSFEILLDDPRFERITLPYIQNLRRLGIDARVRTIDTAQYQRRMDEFDFDMTVGLVAQSDSPGNEQRDYWGSAAADIHGSQNLAGIKSPVVDALIDQIVSATDRATLAANTRALDRVLLWGDYVVPQFWLYADWVASWDRFARPPDNPKVGFDPMLWWVDPQKDAALKAKRG